MVYTVYSNCTNTKINMEKQAISNQIRIGLYRHFKGNEYRVLYIAKHGETLEDMVVYQALYGEIGI